MTVKNIDRIFLFFIPAKVSLILLLIFSFTSCNYARSAKSKVRSWIFGQDQMVQASRPLNEEINHEGTKKIVEITPQVRLQNLMRAFLLNPDSSYKKILLSEFAKHNQLLLSEKRDEEMVSFIGKLLPLFQEQNKEAIEIAVYLSQSLHGPNRDQARKVLGLLVDYAPTDFLRVVATRFPSENCALIQSVPLEVAEDGKKLFLENRVKNLEALRPIIQSDVAIFNALTDCQTSLRNYTSYLFYGKGASLPASVPVREESSNSEVGIGIEAPESL